MKKMLLAKLKGCKKLVVMGIGNELKGDDAIGIYIVKKLMKHFNEDGEFVNIKNLYLINAGTVPDFFTDILKEINPTHILIIDCALMDKEVGEVKVIKEDEIINYSFSTHTLPLPIIIKYLRKFINAEMIILGIQPKIIDFCPISEEVKLSGDKLVDTLIEIIRELKLTE
ncbi:hydrogenase maturation peptidase HycI [Methanocaldococcus fervens]|uniref:Hydrogenase maturation protease HycI n=1 Tax=Methanocaldococcus fervens (strain DSM 4213 / JCM 15782 / AG86) TaxID=573064 RepID=C7P9J9_METFA|nr:hydrogenase maturation peptidase HycI [Methanocaldococcus fervens]ACV25231.1 hydrogenase maturation protease HycI [Methanocaldococcus fervens AG86]